MTNKLSGLKDLIWAAGILLCLLALLIGFFFAAIGKYYGDREKPVLDLSAAHSASQAAPNKDGIDGGLTGGGDSGAATLWATAPDGSLKTLSGSNDAGQGYIDGLTFLVDSSLSALKTSGLTAGQVWTNAEGLPMSGIANWSIVYPGDGSSVSPANAAMVAKPSVLVIAVGSDGTVGLAQEDFISGYESLVRGIISASPETKVICCSVFPVTTVYAGSDGLGETAAAQVNSWIQQVCTDTGAWYADIAYNITANGSLVSQYADGDGKGLSGTGLSAVMSWLRTHAIG